MATTFVQFTRDEFESWLTSVGHKWKVKPGTAGIYVIPLSDTVAVEVSSSMTGRGDVVDYAGASMGARLVSLVTGFTLNKVAQGQNHVKRTINWRDNLGKVIDRLIDAYRKSSAFYDALAAIRDRALYKRDNIAKIEKVPNWSQNDFLKSLHERLTADGILTQKQLDALDRATSRPAPAPQEAPNPNLLGQVRALYAIGLDRKDHSIMDFAKTVGQLMKEGKPGTGQQRAALNHLLGQYAREIDAMLHRNPNMVRVARVAARYLAA